MGQYDTQWINVFRMRPEARTPEYAHEGDSGMDVFACLPYPMRLHPEMKPVKIATGWAIEIPEGYEGQIRSKSGLSEAGILVCPATIDSSYRGEMHVQVYSQWYGVEIVAGQKIAQLVICPVASARLVEMGSFEALSSTSRGPAGFGSTGI